MLEVNPTTDPGSNICAQTRRITRRFVIPTVVLLLISHLLSLSGCAMLQQGGDVFDAIAQYDGLLKTAVVGATIAVLTKKPEFAPRVYEIAYKTGKGLQNTAISAVAVIDRTVREEVRWDRLNKTDRYMVDLLITTVRSEIEGVLKRKGIKEPGEVRLFVAKILNWIAEAAWVRCSSCPAPV